MARTEEDVIQMIKKYKLIAILRKVPAKDLQNTVEALYRGGIRLMEVTFDPSGTVTEGETLAQINLIAGKYKEIAVGAGTVLTEHQVEAAGKAGAEYIISPNTDARVIAAAKNKRLVSIPGALTPTEFQNAFMWGADFVKLFPAGQMGMAYIKDITAPLSHIRILAVGGVDSDNMNTFLEAGCLGAGVGSSLVNKRLIQEKRFSELQSLAEKYVSCITEGGNVNG